MPARASKAPYHRMRVNVTHKSMQQLFNWAYTSIHKFHMRRIHTMISKLPGYVHRQLLYQGGTSLVPHLVGPPCHWFPISLVPISLVPHNIGPPINTHPPPIPLLPNWSPPTHWSPMSSVPRFTSHPLSIYIVWTHWFRFSLVWPPISFIGLFRRPSITLIPHLVLMHHPFHWCLISLVGVKVFYWFHLNGPPCNRHSS